MASESKSSAASSNSVTEEVESRLKQTPEHLFEVFLEIREPIDNETPEILIKYPTDFSDDVQRTAATFAYPCKIPADEQSEHFTFVVLDSTSTIFRFGYCRRSNREATCLCILSYYPWFEVFYTILNDLSHLINSKLTTEMEQYLSLLYNHKLMSNEDFFRNEGKEMIEINSLSKIYTYTRPNQRKLPSMLSNRNFTVMFSRLGPDILLHLFSHLLFERRILFVSSKLFHLTACVYGCLHLIYPMHWQSIFLPILPSSMAWTLQCTAPYIIGIHSSLFPTLNLNELGDVIIVNIDERRLESQHDDLSCFPKYLTRSLKKGIQQSSQLAGDHLARVFLRAMAFAVGNYANGFVLKSDKFDFDRDLYLEQYLGTHVHTFMSAVANTQMFEQFSRYRTYLQRETDIDEFDFEVKQLRQIQQSKKFKTNKKIYKILEKAANPLFEQVQNKAEKLQTVINKAGQRVASEASSVRNNLTSFDITDMIKGTNHSKSSQSMASHHLNTSKSIHQSSTPDLLNGKFPYEKFGPHDDRSSSPPRLINSDQVSSSSSDSSRSSTPDLEKQSPNPLINLDTDDPLKNPLLPSSIVLHVINTPVTTVVPRPIPPIDSKIKQLQTELKYKVQTFDGKRVDPRDEYGQQTEIKRLVKQFDPLNDPTYTNKPHRPAMSMSTPTTASFQMKDTQFFPPDPVTLRPENNPPAMLDRHPSIYEKIPSNYVNNVLQNLQSNYGTRSRPTFRLMQPQQGNNSVHFSPASTAPAALFPKLCTTVSNDDMSLSFDPLAPSNEKTVLTSARKSNGSNLIDLD